MSVTSQKVGKYTYLYESNSYWDKIKKRPDNDKVAIGKIDLHTGEPVYKQEYLDRMAASGESIKGMRLWDKSREARGIVGAGANTVNETALAEAILDSVRDFGVVYFIRELTEMIGLTEILRDTIPGATEEVFALACYLIAQDKPVMYCEEWVASNFGLNAGSMSSQRVSDLLVSFGCAERNNFYRRWQDRISSREYIALDITSVSSYSQQISACEWGYNRDGEDLAQINICMLFGMDSKLPVYQTMYSGSLGDVKTLRATMCEFSTMTGSKELTVIMDKGFFSEGNIDTLLGKSDDGLSFRFLIAAPFSSNLAYNWIEKEQMNIDRLENVILTSGQLIRGVHRQSEWGGTMLNTHVFFNPEKAAKERNELFRYVTVLKQQAEEDPNNRKNAAAYNKYLKIEKHKKSFNVKIREDEVDWELETVGWFVLVSNYIKDTQVAHDMYRAKDVVEKSFMRYKNNLGLDRLRVHGDERLENKLFIVFIALIITSAIHETMKIKNLYKRMTFDSLFLTLAKLKVATTNGKQILRPITKEQTDILKAFDIRLPDYSTCKASAPKKRGRKPKVGK